MSDYIPEEILIEILVKLPVKSLIRGTSICKQWRSLIKSPSFISTHLSKSKNQALVRRYYIKESREHYMVIPKGGPFVINSDSELEFPFKCQIGYFGSCDGLVCLSDEYWRCIIIWNPAIRIHVILPRSLVDPYDIHPCVLGFGVGSNVYKVVRLLCCSRKPQAEIFCLGGTGTWRKLTGFDNVRFRNIWSPIFFEGFVHWIAYDPIIGNSILRFHVGDEVFGETMLPQELERGALMRSLSLAVIGESLGAIKYDMGYERCVVWIMKDYGVKESWTKLYSIDIDTVKFGEPIGFWGSGEALVLAALRGCELATYNLETKRIRHVAYFGYTSSFYVDDYKESLVGYSEESEEELSRGAFEGQGLRLGVEKLVVESQANLGFEIWGYILFFLRKFWGYIRV